MNKQETFSQSDPAGHENNRTTGMRLRELLERKDLGLDRSTYDLLKLVSEQHGHVSHLKIVFISPEEEPNTGGIFHRVESICVG